MFGIQGDAPSLEHTNRKRCITPLPDSFPELSLGFIKINNPDRRSGSEPTAPWFAGLYAHILPQNPRESNPFDHLVRYLRLLLPPDVKCVNSVLQSPACPQPYRRIPLLS
jgi:hypothetical protein